LQSPSLIQPGWSSSSEVDRQQVLAELQQSKAQIDQMLQLLFDDAHSLELIKFAFELRKRDSNNVLTSFFLRSISPPVFVDILESNQWNQGTQLMELRENPDYFRLHVGDN